jgi:hypothetical protein
VTASEQSGSAVRPIVEEALDLFVYAPVGLLSSSLEELNPGRIDELAEQGRSRLGRLLANARVVGHFTITMGRRTIASEFERWRPTEEPPAIAAPESPEPPRVVQPPPPLLRHLGPPPELAIPDYEALSASQVVRRLDGLGPEELEAIYRHESTTRRRRTILHRVQQLLGREDAPGPVPPQS